MEDGIDLICKDQVHLEELTRRAHKMTKRFGTEISKKPAHGIRNGY